MVLEGKLVSEPEGALVPVTLVPMGAADRPAATRDFSDSGNPRGVVWPVKNGTAPITCLKVNKPPDC